MFICQVDAVNMELAKRIIEFETLYPMGLNRELNFYSKEEWVKFTEWAHNKEFIASFK